MWFIMWFTNHVHYILYDIYCDEFHCLICSSASNKLIFYSQIGSMYSGGVFHIKSHIPPFYPFLPSLFPPSPFFLGMETMVYITSHRLIYGPNIICSS